jgi:hypothetical protein
MYKTDIKTISNQIPKQTFININKYLEVQLKRL